MKVSVFKTNIQYKKQVQQLTPLLNSVSDINRWNIDLHDRDKVLRIEADRHLFSEITKLIKQAGYHCEELTD
jgi:3-methyladenine DNA glycosylase Tag